MSKLGQLLIKQRWQLHWNCLSPQYLPPPCGIILLHTQRRYLLSRQNLPGNLSHLWAHKDDILSLWIPQWNFDKTNILDDTTRWRLHTTRPSLQYPQWKYLPQRVIIPNGIFSYLRNYKDCILYPCVSPVELWQDTDGNLTEIAHHILYLCVPQWSFDKTKMATSLK